MANFDLHTTGVPAGLSIIEASAGTGKTWTIAHLLPRLLVDGIVSDIAEVVLVTFTEDAARELGERTRRTLATLMDRVDGGPQLGADEQGIRMLLSRLDALTGPKRDSAVLRLRLALDESDHLTVSTIHSFCKQVLAQQSFLCGMPAGFEVLPDPKELKSDAVKDTWRTDLASDSLLAAAATLGKWSVKDDLKAWRELTQRPSTRMEPVPLSLKDARHQLTHALEVLKNARAGIRLLQGIATRDKVRLKQSAKSPGEDSVAQLDAWHDLLEALDSQQPSVELSVEALDVARKLAGAASWFTRTGAVGKAAVSEVSALEIVVAATAVDASIDITGWAWLAHLRAAAGKRYEQSLRRNNVVTYAGLIEKLHTALCSGPNQAVLAQRLSEKWKVGLIDESQDTDQQQLDIFRAIFDRATGSGRLVLVGDPKQAIYSFRGGDLDAYLAARETVNTSRVSDLATNYRAAHGLVVALNALFGRACAFGNVALAYPDARAACEEGDLPLPTDGQGRLVAWVLPDENIEEWRLAEARRKRAAVCTATAIVDLLGRPMGADANKVNPSHVAVLSRTNHEARLVYQALCARGVPAVIRADTDVMQTDMASDLACVLKALLSPAHPGWRRAAMATRLFGYNSAKLAELSSAEAEQLLVSFSKWGDLWRRRGITALMAGLEAESEVNLCLARGPFGERHLTDLRHLVELLQAQESETQRSPEKLLQWFEGERMSESSLSDERLCRLEQDGDTVQVVTIHRAKGLEFDFVFCPYLWSVMTDRSVNQRLLSRHDDGWVLTDGAQRDTHAEHRARTVERLLEDLRMAYVALTRARRRVTFLAGPLGYTSRSTLPPTALDWLLRTDEGADNVEAWYVSIAKRKTSASGCEHGETLRRLQEKYPDVITVSEPPSPSETVWRSGDHAATPMHTRTVSALDLRDWQLTSFSGLAHGRHQERERRDAMVERQERSATDEVSDTTEVICTDVPLADFARGAHAGNCLHEILECWDFQENTTTLVERGLRRHRLYSDDAARAVRHTLDDLKTTRLHSLDANLETVASDRSLSEWEFLLPLGQAGITGQALSGIFTRHACNEDERDYALDLAGLAGQTLSGMLTGYIDRLVRVDDCWGVVDWKSNYLGPSHADYSRSDMWRCASGQHYLLQIHLYLVALRRYLKLYEPGGLNHVASGSLLFLRGVFPQTDQGVLEITPSEALLDELETLFESSGGGVTV